MKKILAFILIISIVGVLASCGKEKATTEPKPKTCEQIEPCKIALQYATYVEQGAEDKLYKMEDRTGDNKSYDSLETAKSYIPNDFQQYKKQKIKKYGVLEYTLTKNQSYLYKFKYRIVTTLHTNSQGESKLVEELTYPLTSERRVDMIITELAVFSVTDLGLELLETAPGVSLETVQQKTQASFRVSKLFNKNNEVTT